MSEFTIHGASERFNDVHADLMDEIRLMAEAADPAADRIPQPAPRRSFLIWLFPRHATARPAA